MADNFTPNAVSSAAAFNFASDDLGGSPAVHIPRVKVAHGADGTASDANATTPLPVTLAPIASGGATPNRSLDVDETHDTIKGSAGTLYSLFLYNLATAKRFVKLYNSTSPTVGTTATVLVFPLEADQGVTMHWPHGVEFSTGITIAATTGVTDASTTAPGASEIVASWTYK